MNIEIFEIYHDGLKEKPLPMRGRGVAVLMPATDLAMALQTARRMMDFAGMACRIIIAHDAIRQGFIKTANMMAAALEAEFVAYVAQDALAGKDWLRLAHERITSAQAGLCGFNDGKFAGKLATFGLVRCSFAEAFYGQGRIFHEAYRTHRADEELTWLAHLAGQYCYAPEALLMEVDFRMQRPINPDDTKLYLARKPLFPALVRSVKEAQPALQPSK